MKIFCIGYNKTGTTSLYRFFYEEGFKVASQHEFEANINYYLNNEYDKIINLIKEKFNDYDFFQDVPFSFPNFYKTLYKEFPGSKFILSIRNSSEDWYNSLIRFHSTVLKDEFKLYKLSDMEKINKWIYDIMIGVHNGLPEDPYHKVNLINSYETHNIDVNKFFKDKDNFIEINLANKDDFKRLESFLGIQFKSSKFPHVNRTV